MPMRAVTSKLMYRGVCTVPDLLAYSAPVNLPEDEVEDGRVQNLGQRSESSESHVSDPALRDWIRAPLLLMVSSLFVIVGTWRGNGWDCLHVQVQRRAGPETCRSRDVQVQRRAGPETCRSRDMQVQRDHVCISD
ncbi:Calcium-binding protein 7 [Liparis tanakae]|uniref:Calcium-binding protein 7 n=1 Tax=Liparis tanakae TaxID=230148 RepID=A0A4Z2EIF1_9TELE|nr:Calcium-binding protein 7 [Liparis tanakae]